MNLYIFNETRIAAVFGVGTYIRELTNTLRNSNINVCVVNLWSEKPHIQTEEKGGIRYWYFPSPIPEERTANYKKQREMYFCNVVYLLQLLIEDKKELIFHLNYMNGKPLADSLKIAFNCKIVLVVHYLESVMTLLGNISQLRRIISQPNDPTDAKERFAKISFQEEKEMLHTVDKIICLANHTFDLLHQVYQIDKEKMIVIPNGLFDVAI